MLLQSSKTAKVKSNQEEEIELNSTVRGNEVKPVHNPRISACRSASMWSRAIVHRADGRCVGEALHCTHDGADEQVQHRERRDEDERDEENPRVRKHPHNGRTMPIDRLSGVMI